MKTSCNQGRAALLPALTLLGSTCAGLPQDQALALCVGTVACRVGALMLRV